MLFRAAPALTLAVALATALACHAAAPLARVANFRALHPARADAPSVLRLYLIPTAPIKLKWGSPRQLLLTTIETAVVNSSHPIGHAAVEVQYRGLDDAEHHVFTGASDVGSGAGRQLLLEDQLGFSILERAWPGLLSQPTEMLCLIALIAALLRYEDTGTPRWAQAVGLVQARLKPAFAKS